MRANPGQERDQVLYFIRSKIIGIIACHRFDMNMANSTQSKMCLFKAIKYMLRPF